MTATTAYQTVTRVVLLLIVGTVLALTAVATMSAVSHQPSTSTTQNLAGHCYGC